jgi:hypothetical protein
MTSIARRQKQQKGWREVLVLSMKKQHQGTIRRHYLRWRKEQGIPFRCDEPACRFHNELLEWNGIPLSLTLDHKDGNRYDNAPASLRLLCPNCDSQLGTKGGGNRGRVVSVVGGGYTLRNKDGTFIVAATMVPTAGIAEVSAIGSTATPKPDV